MQNSESSCRVTWKPYDEVDTWVGEEGVCPVCHNPLLSMNGTTHVECPICGIWGDLKVDGEKVKVEWSEKEIARAEIQISEFTSITMKYKHDQSMCAKAGRKQRHIAEDDGKIREL